MGSIKDSKVSVKSSVSSSKTNTAAVNVPEDPDPDGTRSDFIYGGPFVKQDYDSPFINTSTPINLPLQGIFKQSFAYKSLRDRYPVILTKIIDYLAREGQKVKSLCGGNDEDLRKYIEFINKLKSELMTNKPYELLTVETAEARKWNTWIEETPYKRYYTNGWLFTECYVYRRLREGCELYKSLETLDPFQEQKEMMFEQTLEPMCIVAERMAAMLPESEKDKRKADFQLLVKLSLWANRNDLSITMAQPDPSKENLVTKTEQDTKYATPRISDPKVLSSVPPVNDPIQMVLDLKDKLLVDDSGKAADQIVIRAGKLRDSIAAEAEPVQAPPPGQGEAVQAPPPAQAEGGEEPPAPVPCPAKMVLPQVLMYDIVCDNAGFELFMDICVAHFLISQKIVEKVRFHVKRIPWFVSDVTARDFRFMVDACCKATYKREVPAEPKPGSAPASGAQAEPPPEPEPPRTISAEPLQALGAQWQRHVADGAFIIMDEEFWTSPHAYKDMKKYDYNLYRKLQYAVGVMFKGDLNYRKLLADRNCNPVIGFEPALQGFIPAPILAVRTVKSDLICALPKGKWEQLNNINAQWMETGEYGVISFCAKAEPLKVSDRPCADYGDQCRGAACPIHADM